MPLTLSSPAFTDNGEIPTRYTCDGDDAAPPLTWSGIPDGTRSLALIVDDPDAPDPRAPRMIWIHWVLYNIPADAAGIPEAATVMHLPDGTRVGLNDWKRTGYGGPCPPILRHRYRFNLYALNDMLPDLRPPTAAGLERAMEGHIVERTVLTGTYQRPGR